MNMQVNEQASEQVRDSDSDQSKQQANQNTNEQKNSLYPELISASVLDVHSESFKTIAYHSNSEIEFIPSSLTGMNDIIKIQTLMTPDLISLIIYFQLTLQNERRLILKNKQIIFSEFDFNKSNAQLNRFLNVKQQFNSETDSLTVNLSPIETTETSLRVNDVPVSSGLLDVLMYTYYGLKLTKADFTLNFVLKQKTTEEEKNWYHHIVTQFLDLTLKSKLNVNLICEN